jgi:hypothetical protein
MYRLWIADPEPSQRRTIAWSLRDLFESIDELDSIGHLNRALGVAGPFERLFESESDGWHLLALVRGGRHLVVVACRTDEIAMVVRQSVRR